MFICAPCLEKNYANVAMFVSHGRCEQCEEVTHCHDIPSKYLKLKTTVMKYDYTKDYPGVINISGADSIGSEHGMIPVYLNGKPMNLHVTNGWYLVYKGNGIGIKETENGTCKNFYKLRSE